MIEKNVWLVTGAGRGLGVDIARAALSAGHAVVATARNTDSIDSTLGQHDDLLSVPLDVTDPAAAEQPLLRLSSGSDTSTCSGARSHSDRPCDPTRSPPPSSGLEHIDGGSGMVRGLDCLDGTPLLDLKPDRTLFVPLAPPQPGDYQHD